MIYIVEEFRGTRTHGAIKIGTANDVARRVSALQTGNRYKLLLRATFDGDRSTESLLHEHFRDHRIRYGGNEWFRWCKEIEEVIKIGPKAIEAQRKLARRVDADHAEALRMQRMWCEGCRSFVGGLVCGEVCERCFAARP